MDASRATPVAVIDGRLRSADDAGALTEVRGDTVVVRWPDGVRLTLERARSDAGDTLAARVTAASAPIHLDAVGVRLPHRSTEILVDGYQSWDWAGVRSLETAGEGWWGAVVRSAGVLQRIALAAPPVGGATRITWSADAPALDVMTTAPPPQAAMSGGPAAGLRRVLGPGESFSSDPVICGPAPLRGPGAGVPAMRDGHRPGSRRTGWMTWNALDRNIDTRSLLAGAEQAAPRGVVLLDDGWMDRWGDWTPGSRFPGGLQPAIDAIRASGREFGLWIAPFMVHPDSMLARDHPEWLLRDATGTPVTARRAPEPHFVLDASLPEVRAHLRDIGARLASWGVTSIKADFLYAGAMEGERHGMTGMESLRAGVAALREGAESIAGEVSLWGCGGPAPALAGVVDALRSGSDSVFDQPPDALAPKGFPGIPVRDVLRAQQRNAWARAWLWGDTVPLDVDAIQLGGLGNLPPLRDADMRSWLRLARRSGGPLLLSDTPRTTVSASRGQWLARVHAAVQDHRPSVRRPRDPFLTRPTPSSETIFHAPVRKKSLLRGPRLIDGV